MEQGAAGIVYGRNVIQHDDPRRDDARAHGVVHEGATPEDALAPGAPVAEREPSASASSAAGSWAASSRAPPPAGPTSTTSASGPSSSPSATRTPTCSPGTSGSSRRRASSADYRDLLADERSTPSTAPSRTTCTRSSTSTLVRAGQAPARREAVRHRPGRRTRRSSPRSQAHPELLVRCSSEFPFFPGGQEVARLIRERRFGRSSRCASLFLHSSDLDPQKPINWKRQAALNGEYGVPRRPRHARAAPAAARRLVAAERARDPLRRLPRAARRRRRHGACDTWDNASCSARPRTTGAVPAADRDQADRAGRDEHLDDRDRRHATASIAYTTKHPKTLRCMDYEPGGPQAWQTSTSAPRRPTRRSPARSSSSASRTRSCRCGRRSSTSWHTARGHAPALPLRDAGEAARRTGSSRRRSSHSAPQRWLGHLTRPEAEDLARFVGRRRLPVEQRRERHRLLDELGVRPGPALGA